MTAAGVVDDYLGMLLSTAAAAAPATTADGARHTARTSGAAVPAGQADTGTGTAVVVEATPMHDAPVPAPAPGPLPVAAPTPTRRSTPTPAAAAKVVVATQSRAAPTAPGLLVPPPQQRRAADRMARWLRLRCGAQAYAIELLKIREVVLPAPLLALRGAAPCLAGVMNLRGQVVPVVDLGLQLGDTAVADTPAARIIVLEDNGEVLGLRVSAVEDVVLIGDAQIEGTHTSRLAPVGDHRIRGIARFGGAVMLLLDAARLMALPLFPAR